MGYSNPPRDFDSPGAYGAASVIVQEWRVAGDTYVRRQDLADGTILTGDGVSPPTVFAGGGVTYSVLFSQATAATGASGTVELLAAGSVTKLRLSVSTAPTGAALTVDVLLDAVVIDTLTMAAGSTAAVISVPADEYPAGALLSVEVTQVGSTVAGAGVVVQVTLEDS